jgi:hypothetical protein
MKMTQSIAEANSVDPFCEMHVLRSCNMRERGIFLQRISKQRLRLTAQTTTSYFDNFGPKVVSKLSNVPAIETYLYTNVVTQK